MKKHTISLKQEIFCFVHNPMQEMKKTVSLFYCIIDFIFVGLFTLSEFKIKTPCIIGLNVK